MRPLAAAFAAAGHAVELPLLPGHGTTADDMATSTWDDWTSTVLAAYDALAERCDRVAVAGLSMGGALAAWAAVERPAAAVVVVNPAVEAPVAAVRDSIATMLAGGTTTIPAMGNDVADPAMTELAYDTVPVAALVSLFDGQAKLVPRLGEIACPVLIFTSRQDHVVPTTASELLAGAVAGPVEVVWLERSYHVATLDYDHELIEQKAVKFLSQVLH
jgi:carboxylesterase